MSHTILIEAASATVDAATGSLYTSQLHVQAYQRIDVGIVVGSLSTDGSTIVPGGSFTGIVTLQRLLPGDEKAENWRDVSSWTVATESISDKPQLEPAQYRLGIKAGQHTAGDCVIRLGTA